MKIRDRHGATFELTPVGYQFPSADDLHDRNWLNVQVRVTSAHGSWGGVDPCLLTWELDALAQWMRAWARGAAGTAEPALEFMEPELDFECAAGEPEMLLRVGTSYGLAGGAAEPGERRVVNLVVSRDEILKAATELVQDAARYPRR
jgi:hypothetical protein